VRANRSEGASKPLRSIALIGRNGAGSASGESLKLDSFIDAYFGFAILKLRSPNAIEELLVQFPRRSAGVPAKQQVVGENFPVSRPASLRGSISRRWQV
jgi:hypothetical protein